MSAQNSKLPRLSAEELDGIVTSHISASELVKERRGVPQLENRLFYSRGDTVQ